MLKIVIALILLAHGIGHSLGLLQVFRIAVVNPQWNGDSWLLSGGATSLAQGAGVVLWTLALVGFVGTAAVVMGWLPGAWWPSLAIGSAVVSLLGLALFPTAFPTTSTLGALAVDVLVLFAVVWQHWTPDSLAG